MSYDDHLNSLLAFSPRSSADAHKEAEFRVLGPLDDEDIDDALKDFSGSGLNANAWGIDDPSHGPNLNRTNGLWGFDFDGADDYGEAPLVASSYFDAGLFWYAAALNIRTSAAPYTGESFQLPGVFGDSAGWIGLYIKSDVLLRAYHDGDGEKYNTLAYALASVVTVVVRFDGTNMHMRLNGGAEQSVAAGDVGDLTNVLYLGSGASAYSPLRLHHLSLGKSSISAANSATIAAALAGMVSTASPAPLIVHHRKMQGAA